MDMQDKELDDLFRSKLNELEVQPSARVWGSIADGLATGRRKKRLLPLLSIAASIIVVVAAGVLFIPQKQNTGGKYEVKNNAIVLINSKNTPSAVKKTQSVNKAPLQVQKPATTIYASVSKAPQVHQPKKINISPVAQKSVTDTSVVNNTNTPILATVKAVQANIVKAVVPDERTQLTASVPDKDIAPSAIIPQQLPVAASNDVPPVKKKHRIKSFGDMVNVVVAKIDKRQDKFIEFSNTDGDEATITSVNLGIVKINSGGG